MSNTLPPIKARHLRLVPPLDDALSAETPPFNTGGQQAPWGELLPLVRAQRTGARLGWATVWLVVAAGVWAAGAVRTRKVSKPALPGVQLRPQGPSFDAYAQGADGQTLGRPLAEGDVLFADDHLVLGIHNAPAPGLEAAQFAAVFAMDESRHIAALYPALGPNAAAMPLPQVGSMALLDGPQLDGGPGPVTLVAVFLREQVALGALMDALAQAPMVAPGFGPELPDLSHAVVRLQRVTLAHGERPHGAP